MLHLQNQCQPTAAYLRCDVMEAAMLPAAFGSVTIPKREHQRLK